MAFTDDTSAALDELRRENARLVEALSSERRANLRLLQEHEAVIAQLQEELTRLRAHAGPLETEEEPPRHSWVVRREPVQHTADTVRPPPLSVKR
jgi:stress-induced morphogen